MVTIVRTILLFLDTKFGSFVVVLTFKFQSAKEIAKRERSNENSRAARNKQVLNFLFCFSGSLRILKMTFL